MTRISKDDLERLVRFINERTGHATEPYTKVNGEYKPNAGNYHLSGAYGGYSLHQMCSTGSGTSDVFRCGHVAKRDLYNRMSAFHDGLAVE